ncbi:hypothetical protein MM236_16260 [Belliella sp. DSM 107340]|uniref:DUF2178 domain-containing protein n=1 Tax=Belliella calami TaxID=2923436 RepID=A0ABS9USG1_9BACT|nr:hypothetical protein [Belliella calami]MCH7399558.1 hypothetical protein [Belliella calami]
MKKKHLAIFHMFWSIGIVVLVCLSLEEFKFLPVLAVVSMALAINYAIYANYKNDLSENRSGMKKTKQLERNKKLKIIFSVIALLLFSIQLLISYGLVSFKYESYFGAIVLFILVVLMSIIIFKQKKSESLE